MYLLVIIDIFSRYTLAEIMSSITTERTIGKLKRIFGMMGHPRVITSGNDPQFTSELFRNFVSKIGAVQNLVTPYSPWQNGLVERQDRDIKHFTKISREKEKLAR